MGVFNSVTGGFFDLLFFPFRGLSPWIGMAAVSVLTAFLMLWIYKLTSNQDGIRRAKNAIKAHLLELRLFKDDLRVSFRAQKRILRANARYLALNAKPLLVMIVPLVLILAQLNLRFGYSPLEPGGEAVVKIRLDRSTNPLDLAVSVTPSEGVAVETPAVRIPDLYEIVWRIKALRPGTAVLSFGAAGFVLDKTVSVSGKRLSVVSPRRPRGFLPALLYPGEKPLPSGPVKSIEVLYEPAKLSLLGMNIYWLVAYLVLSVVFGFGFKGVFKVEI
jgi:uncharacterized membrane protein (DUF106 family)